MKADYQLRHQLYGRQGSMWESQVDDATRQRIRAVVKSAGMASVLAEIDQTAAAATGGGQVLIEDAYFRFVDGNFAVVGRHQSDYDHTPGLSGSGERLQNAYRTGPATSSTDPVETRLARITREFTESITDDTGTLSADRDWYLVPVPPDLTPLVIEGKDDGVYLVNGIDFTARTGYIVMTDHPARVLPAGLVRVNSAYQQVESPNSFALSAPAGLGRRYLAEYAYKSQSVSAFRRAAAEYAGLYVFQSADVVLDAQEVYTGTWVYTMAEAGAVVIDYPHTQLALRQEVNPGTVICGRFDVVASNYGDLTNIKKFTQETWDQELELDGVLPVQGLTWDGQSLVRVDQPHGYDYVRFHFDGPPSVQARYWQWQYFHEQATGADLYAALGSPALPAQVDFWDILDTYYSSRLILAIASDHTPTINARLRKFLLEHHPKSCNILLGLKATLPVNGVLKDEYGHHVVGEDGEYIPATEETLCADNIFSHEGNILALAGGPLTIEVCDDPAEAPFGYRFVKDDQGRIVRDDSGAYVVVPVGDQAIVTTWYVIPNEFGTAKITLDVAPAGIASTNAWPAVDPAVST